MRPPRTTWNPIHLLAAAAFLLLACGDGSTGPAQSGGPPLEPEIDDAASGTLYLWATADGFGDLSFLEGQGIEQQFATIACIATNGAPTQYCPNVSFSPQRDWEACQNAFPSSQIEPWVLVAHTAVRQRGAGMGCPDSDCQRRGLPCQAPGYCYEGCLASENDPTAPPSPGEMQDYLNKVVDITFEGTAIAGVALDQESDGLAPSALSNLTAAMEALNLGLAYSKTPGPGVANQCPYEPSGGSCTRTWTLLGEAYTSSQQPCACFHDNATPLAQAQCLGQKVPSSPSPPSIVMACVKENAASNSYGWCNEEWDAQRCKPYSGTANVEEFFRPNQINAPLLEALKQNTGSAALIFAAPIGS